MFLPASGYRSTWNDSEKEYFPGSYVYGVHRDGRYWASMDNGNYSAYSFCITPSEASVQYNIRCQGFSVRLVQDIP